MNPYWKDGGTGLPSDRGSDSAQNSEGRSWILRSYKRALEQAEQKNVPFEEIAKKQWGSVEKIHSLLRSAGIDPANPDSSFLSSNEKLLYAQSRVDYSSGMKHSISTSRDFMRPQSTSTKAHSKSKSFLRPGNDDLIMGDSKSHTQNWRVTQKAMSGEPTDTMPTTSQEDTKAPKDLPQENVSEAMINAVSAKLIKAELIGNKDKVKALQLQLDELRSRKKIQDSVINQVPADDKGEEKTVLLTQTDRFGRVRPAKLPSDESYLRGRSSKGKSKKRYGNEDHSISYLVEQERMLTADDTYEAIAKMASKFVRSNPEDVVDDVVDQAKKSNASKESEKMKLKVLSESRKFEEIMDNCKFCVKGSNFKKHLVIAMGAKIYLSVPPYRSLTDGHCLIVPLDHTPCALQMDEDVWGEVKSFQRSLTKMFDDNNMDVIFTECYTSPIKRSHMYIDCLPVPKDEGSMAPMYFKKAILESDSEWAQNRKLIDTRRKALKNCVPLGLPYFFVDFNNEGGFAHVIEDSSLFPQYFAKEVVGGLIDAEPRLWLKPPYENFEQQKRKTSKLTEMWKPYDWTDTK